MIKEKIKRVTKTPTTELPAIWERGFFKEWRSAGEVSTEFSKSGCHFSASAVSNALKRASFITRRGKGSNIRYAKTYPFENKN